MTKFGHSVAKFAQFLPTNDQIWSAAKFGQPYERLQRLRNMKNLGVRKGEDFRLNRLMAKTVQRISKL